jgi:RecA/RadA recombinase
MRTKPEKSLSQQVRDKVEKPSIKTKEYDGNFKMMINTGSTLLNLAISGRKIRGGGVQAGTIVEAFGPSQSGKTVLLSELAGDVQRKLGEIQFHDPEARLDQEFASIFGMHIPSKNYYKPDTITDVFEKVRKWVPKSLDVVNGIFVDSSAALSTNLEMTSEDGDKMGGRRGKEFSEQMRKTCRIIENNNYIMVFSNQIRDSFAAYGPKTVSPGGHAFEFYASTRIKFNSAKKITKTVKIAGKDVERVIGINVEIEVIKTVDDPYRKANIYIIYRYGIDDIRANLQYIKDFTKNTTYTCCGESLGISMEEAIHKVESQGLISDLKNEVIDLWERIEKKFETERKPKER